ATSQLVKFHFPVVLVHGDKDDLIPIERAREVRDVISHAHLVEMKGVGHMPMMENPKQTAQALRHLK
ncbi:MAG TPA: alpha/beta hydrolase, partial [Anaerolineales bacterium]|nr:hypothetical protein [Anaerolineae bacterium]HRK88718.1 alpha/beta hydrolase [Anaerolineales bacterium]